MNENYEQAQYNYRCLRINNFKIRDSQSFDSLEPWNKSTYRLHQYQINDHFSFSEVKQQPTHVGPPKKKIFFHHLNTEAQETYKSNRRRLQTEQHRVDSKQQIRGLKDPKQQMRGLKDSQSIHKCEKIRSINASEFIPLQSKYTYRKFSGKNTFMNLTKFKEQKIKQKHKYYQQPDQIYSLRVKNLKNKLQNSKISTNFLPSNISFKNPQDFTQKLSKSIFISTEKRKSKLISLGYQKFSKLLKLEQNYRNIEKELLS